MLFVLLILLADSLEIISPLDSLYVLAKKEYMPITLDNYFIGDELSYSISPNLTEVILKQSNVQYDSTRTHNLLLVPQNKVAKMNAIFQGSIFCPYCFVFANGTNFAMISINDTDVKKNHIDFTNDITSFIVVQITNIISVVYVVTTGGSSKINEMFYIEFAYIFDTNISEVTTTDTFKKLVGSSLRFSEGVITDTLLATGSYEDIDYVIIFNITKYSSPKILGEYAVQMLASEPVLTATYCNTHFIYIPKDNKIVKIEINDQSEIKISNTLYLETKDKEVTSLNLQYSPNLYRIYLILGMTDEFIILTMDFKQVFFKYLGKNQGSIYSYPNIYNNVLLLKKDSGYNIKVTASDFAFHVFGGIDVNITDSNFSWAVFNESDDGFSFIYTNGENVVINSIILNNAMLNLSSTSEDRVYNFSIIDSLSNEKYEQTITVIQPKEIGNIYTLNISRTNPIVVFNNFTAELTLNLYDYFYGYYLEVSNVSVSFSSDFFDYSVRYISNLNRSVTLSFNNTKLWFTDIVSDNKSTYFYNSSDISILEGSQLIPKVSLNVNLTKIISCPGYFIVNYTQKENNKIVITPLLDDIHFIYAIEKFCSVLQCSAGYIICDNEEVLLVYKVEGTRLLIELYNISLSSNQSFSSFYLSNNDLLCIIQNKVNFTLYSLNTIKSTALNIVSKTLSKPAVNIFAGLNNFFIVYEDNNMEIYDGKGFYLKNITVPIYEKLYYVNNFIVFISGKFLTIYNSTGFVASILIAQDFIINHTISNAFYNDNMGLIIHVVANSDVITFNVPLDYSSASFEFNMNNFSSIDNMFYYANITISANNTNSKCETIIPITLYTNGQTIYKNLEVINNIQSNLLDLPCKSSNQISLENMFLGQDLIVSVEGDKIFSFNQRITKKTLNETFNMSITAFVTVEDFDVYLIATEGVVGVYSKSFDKIDTYNLEDKNTITICADFSVVLEDDFFIFSAACNMQIVFDLNTNESIIPISSMFFFRYENEKIYIISHFFLMFSVDSIWGLGKIGGEFLIMTLDFYNETTNGYYCNHLQLMLGTAKKDSVSESKLLYISPNDIFMNYYYFIDFEGVYDPIFDVYYLYLLDIYSGIKVLNFSNTPDSHYNLITTIPLENGRSLMRCGLELYVALQNATILKYKLQNWDNPQLIGKVFPYRDLYTVFPGALKCSEYNYAAYLLTLMQDDNGNAVIHVIDNKAQELSSIISDIETFSSAVRTYAYFYNSTTILVLTPTKV
ncbi:hypothetical protein SteCoe_36261 [Stentor coeruleus]|uniref:Cleavage/polyadenylation specificity factor A subunit C-terminal domain-containing protein n=1 Tax=Stentor coeruleus TaxID=5963 RepID=A0A1R2AQI8_9CILI|nr:hypothetical protein SteCoe_36261 [Stentor coeruleus]